MTDERARPVHDVGPGVRGCPDVTGRTSACDLNLDLDLELGGADGVHSLTGHLVLEPEKDFCAISA